MHAIKIIKEFEKQKKTICRYIDNDRLIEFTFPFISRM